MTDRELVLKTFDWLRFPLAVMVVYLHNFQVVEIPYIIDWEHLNGVGIFNILRVYGSLVFTNVAVPLFFLISGYLFFKGFDKWEWKLYAQKLLRRFHSLLIPYIAWITVAILVAISLKGISLSVHHEGFRQFGEWFSTRFSLSSYWNSESWNADRLNWLGKAVPSSSPFLTPMWYVRDLMVMVVLSPIIYWAILYGGAAFLLLLFISYISLVWPFLPGFDIESFFFFTLGGLFVIKDVDIFRIKHLKQVSAVIFISLSILLVFFYGHLTFIGNKIYPFCVISGVFAIFLLSANIVKFNSFSKINKAVIGLKDTSFFLFAFHAIILPYVNKGFMKALPDHFLSYILVYLLSPVIVVMISVFICRRIKAWCPSLSKILTGR